MLKVDQIEEITEQHPKLMQPYPTVTLIMEITIYLTALKVKTKAFRNLLTCYCIIRRQKQ